MPKAVHLTVIDTPNSETACLVEERHDVWGQDPAIFEQWFATLKRTHVLADVTCKTCLRVNAANGYV